MNFLIFHLLSVLRVRQWTAQCDYSWIQNKHEQMKNFLLQWVLIICFFCKHPEASIQAVFALEGLSHLVAASFREDGFGIVQTTRPAILGTLLILQKSVQVL